MKKQNKANVINIENFAPQNGSTKSTIGETIKLLVRQTNKNKYNYDQLKYIFKEVRERCDVSIPSPSKKLIELPSDNEIKLFYKAITNPVHKLIFETLEGTGLRISELCSLEVKRIDFKKNTAFVFEGKGKKDRIIIIGESLAAKLSLYLDGKNHRYLFESIRNTKFTSRRIEQLCKKYKELSGLEISLTPHTWRHIWNTRLAEAGVSKEKRALLAGHSNDATQDIYTHLSLGGMKEEILEILK